MIQYKFTNDLRVTELREQIKFNSQLNKLEIDVRKLKSINNVKSNLTGYFLLGNGQKAQDYALCGDVEKVILNFVKKFQFPNFRHTKKDFENYQENGQKLAPYRVILGVLNAIENQDDQWLTLKEIKEFIFYYRPAATGNADINEIKTRILSNRSNDGQTLEELDSYRVNQRVWKCDPPDRQLQELLNILIHGLHVVSYDDEKYKLNHQYSEIIQEILLYNDFWEGNCKKSYDEYMDMESINTFNSNPIPQLILQGPPGTGKSHKLSEMLMEYGIDQENDKDENNERFERVVGHPELTSADFIGQYRPMTRGEENELEYSFVPGPFTRLLKQALNDSKQAYILIIEELNRTNSAAMFAEIFQLLDRRADGQSQYKVNLGLDVNRYLLDKTTDEKDKAFELRAAKHKVRLPANFAIWATMNTADQGVFPLDTAFKRRWSFEYLGVDDGEKVWGEPDDNGNYPWDPKISDDMTWQMLRKGINQVLSDHGKDEDRQLGGFFLTQRELGWDPVKNCLINDHMKTIQGNIMTKVIGYLRDDVLRYEPQVLFEVNDKEIVKGFSGLISQMKAKGILSVFRANDVATWKTEFNQYIAKYQVASQKDKLAESAQSNDDNSSGGTSDESKELNTPQADQTNQGPEPNLSDDDSNQNNDD